MDAPLMGGFTWLLSLPHICRHIQLSTATVLIFENLKLGQSPQKLTYSLPSQHLGRKQLQKTLNRDTICEKEQVTIKHHMEPRNMAGYKIWHDKKGKTEVKYSHQRMSHWDAETNLSHG